MATQVRRRRSSGNPVAPGRRIALLMNLTTRRGREHFRGVQRYSWPIRRWMIRTGPANLAAVTEAIAWKPDGIIMQVSDLRMIPILQDSGIPVVDVSGRFAEQPFARVESDNPAIGRMAAEHFLSKGFRNLGYLGDSTSEASQLREEGFRRRLQEAGLTASVRTLGEGEEIYQQWGEVQPAIEQWLRGLRKPVGVFAYDDQFAVLASQACIRAGLSVPEQVALLGVENDDVLCHHGYPPLSSVQTAQEQGGFEAARLLDRLMAGRAAARSSLLLAPLRVVERASTDILAIGDADVAAAVRFINEHATERINVGDVVAAVPVSRRVLESRFHKAMGRTILEELHRVRVERVKQLLQTSSDSMRRIAKATGFRNDSHLWVVFKKLTRISPRVYRHRAEVSDAAEERPQPPA